MLNQWPKITALFSAALLTSVLLSACSDDTTIGSKSLVEEQSFTIPGFPLAINVPPSSIDIDINLDEQAGYQEGDFDYVTEVSVRDITFEINPESNNAATDSFEDGNLDSFEFVSSLTLSLVAVVDGAQQVVQVASLPISDPQIASDMTTLSLDVENTDIRDLIESPTGCKLRIEIAGTTPPDAVLVDAKIRFRVGLGFR